MAYANIGNRVITLGSDTPTGERVYVYNGGFQPGYTLNTLKSGFEDNNGVLRATNISVDSWFSISTNTSAKLIKTIGIEYDGNLIFSNITDSAHLYLSADSPVSSALPIEHAVIILSSHANIGYSTCPQATERNGVIGFHASASRIVDLSISKIWYTT